MENNVMEAPNARDNPIRKRSRILWAPKWSPCVVVAHSLVTACSTSPGADAGVGSGDGSPTDAGGNDARTDAGSRDVESDAGHDASVDAAHAIVTIARIDHYITPSGVIDVPVDRMAEPPPKAWTLNGGNLVETPVRDGVPGYFTLELPEGTTYYLESRRMVLVTSARTIDLGWNIQGRPNTDDLDAPSSFHVTATGLVPWTTDGLELSTESVFENASLVSTSTIAPGTTQLNDMPFDYGSLLGTALDATKGDTAVLKQVHREDSLASSISYVVAAGRTGPVTIATNKATHLNVTMNALAQKNIAPDLRGSEFTAHLSQVHPNARVGSIQIRIAAVPGGLDRGDVGWLGELLSASFVPRNFVDGVHALHYGNPDETWGELGVAGAEFYTDVQLPGADPTLFGSWVGRVGPAATLFASPIRSDMQPPQSLRVDGQSAQTSSSAAMSTTPLLSWTAPSVGSPTHYRGHVRELRILGHQTFVRAPRLIFLTSATNFRIPPGFLESGKSYLVVVSASNARGGQFSHESAPEYGFLTESSAEVVSSPIVVP